MAFGSPAPTGSKFEQLGPGKADEQDRRIPRPVRDVLHELEEGRLAPVDVLEDDDQGL